MATAQDIEDARSNARIAVLEAIAQKAADDRSSPAVLQLAEAFAWLTAWDQSHGGSPGSGNST